MSEVAAQERRLAEALRLRAPPPVPVRLSRRAVVVTVLVAGTALTGVLAWSLTDRPPRTPPEAEPPPAQPGEHLGRLPRDYAEAARIPPRLAAASPTEEVAVGRQARTSGLFAGGSSTPAPPPPPARKVDDGAAASEAAPAAIDGAAAPRLLAGTSIRAALVTGVRSDLPGPVTAQVTENVHDSVSGATLLVPQGSRLIGAYDHETRFGQQRVLLTWSRLILPDGRAVELGREPATDPQGYAGLADRVDRKWGQLLGASLVAFGLTAGTALADQDSDDELWRALRTGGADVANLAAGQVVSRSLDIRPSLTVRPGFPVRVLLTRDLVLEPWRDA